LTAQASQGVPAEAVAALNSPNALITQEALQRLADLMTQLPNGTELMQATSQSDSPESSNVT